MDGLGMLTGSQSGGDLFLIWDLNRLFPIPSSLVPLSTCI